MIINVNFILFNLLYYFTEYILDSGYLTEAYLGLICCEAQRPVGALPLPVGAPHSAPCVTFALSLERYRKPRTVYAVAW